MGRGGGRPTGGAGAGVSAYQTAVKEVFQMSTSLTGLRRMVDLLGGPKDTVELRQRAAELKDKIAGHAKSVTASLKELGAGGADRSAVTKLASDFEGVLKDFQRLQRVMADKCTHHKPRNPHSASAAHAAAVMQHTETTGRQEEEEAEALLAREANKQELIELDNMIDYNQALIEERDQGIAEIQQQIGEVNEMFQDLAVLVNDQGEQLQDIESNIFVTAERTAESRDELVRAARIQRKSRRCWCWMSVIITLVLFVLFFIIFGIN